MSTGGAAEDEPADPGSLARADELERGLVEEVEAGNEVPIDAQGNVTSPSVVPLEPDDALRRTLVRLLFGLIVLSLVAICLGLALHWFDADFSSTILQVIVGPVVGALAAVVGYLFGERKGGS